MQRIGFYLSFGLILAGCNQPTLESPASLNQAQDIPASRFTLFESGQVRPLALSPDGSRLFSVNTPDGRLEVFDVKNRNLVPRGSIAVGLEPVAVAARTNDEVWVVNHLSDSVSIVQLDSSGKGRIVRTLLVGDEPRDIVFGGPAKRRAFITTAHRGQNDSRDPQLTTPSVGRADVWVFDTNDYGNSLGGTPLTILTLFSDTPRALAVTPDGSRVYAAAFQSGNRTTALHEQAIPDGGQSAGGLPGPNTNHQGISQPETGLIVKFNGSHWVDSLNRIWDDKVPFSLPDKDVFVIDAMANPPAQLPGAAGYYQTVGTTLFNMAVNPVNGKVYVTNTEARNDQRFEGPGIFAGSTVRGHLAESRITVLSGSQVLPRHLNKHINYNTCCGAAPNAENSKSLAMPLGMAITSNGQKLYVAAFGSSKVGVFDTAQLENDTFVPSAANQISVRGGGPSGVVVDDARHRLYVLTRFDNSISIIDTDAQAEIAHIGMHTPEPASVVRGRPFLYNAALTSSHGDSSCASCHTFGDVDHLAWDLGNPDEGSVTNPGPYALDPVLFGVSRDFFPMKGPMTTQSLRGLANHGPMHWRGDRTASTNAPSVQPDGGAFNEQVAFNKFNVAFEGLLGRSSPLADADMQAFTDFALQITYPPNPIRALNNSLTPDQQAGRDFYFQSASDPSGACVSCHTLDPNGNRQFGVSAPGFFGTDGRYTAEPETQFFKIPHLRNMYQKVGMFGQVGLPLFNPIDNGFMGDQIRGFGFLHDGSDDTMFRFLNGIGFNQHSIFGDLPGAFPNGTAGDPLRRQVESFLFAYDSNLAPIVGQQVTLSANNLALAGSRVALLQSRAAVGECDLIVRGMIQGRERGFLFSGNRYRPDRSHAPSLSMSELFLLAFSPGQELTFTCTPPGSGRRMGIDRDEDGILDGDDDAWN